VALVVITGSTGFIGREVRGRLAQKHQVFALTRRAALPPEDGVVWVTGDLADAAMTARLPTSVDAVVFLAQGARYREFPAGVRDVFDANVAGLLAVLEYAREHGASRFVLASSANVYARSPLPITEEGRLAPSTFYARSKRMGELLVESYGQCFRCVVLRLFTVYGPGQRGTLVPALIERVRMGDPVEIEGRDGLRLSPVFVDDVGHVIQTVLERDDVPRGADTFNVGGTEAVDIRGLSELMGELVGRVPHHRVVEGEPAGWVADTTKLRATFALDPFTGLREGLRRTIEGAR
jgi:UDP-glucose 4-epimerase